MEIGKIVRGWLMDYMTSGPMVKMIVQGIHAVDMVRKMVGNSTSGLSGNGHYSR